MTRPGLELDWLWKSPFKVKNGSIWSDHTEIGLHSMATKWSSCSLWKMFMFHSGSDIFRNRGQCCLLEVKHLHWQMTATLVFFSFFLATLVFWLQWRLQEKSSFLKRAVNYIAWLFRRKQQDTRVKIDLKNHMLVLLRMASASQLDPPDFELKTAQNKPRHSNSQCVQCFFDQITIFFWHDGRNQLANTIALSGRHNYG